MRIIKSAHGFSVSVASTIVRVVMITLEGEPRGYMEKWHKPPPL